MPVQETGQLTGELHTLLTRAAFAPSGDSRFLRITESDATRWLNGMVTNSIQGLAPGEGNYSFLLNAQGRILGDAVIYREPGDAKPGFLLQTSREQVDTLRQLLDRFIIMDDVELTDALEDDESLLLFGSGLPAVAADLQLPVLSPGRLAHAPTVHGPVLVTTPPFSTVPAMALHASPAVLQQMEQKFKHAGILPVSSNTLEQLRILEARPRYGTDIRNAETAKDLPQETAQAHALHFAKGCYVGQEIVERIRSRGQVHRLFTAFRLQGVPPETFPVPLEASGKPAGELTSAVAVETTEGRLWLALGYARREALETKASFTYPGGTALRREPGEVS